MHRALVLPLALVSTLLACSDSHDPISVPVGDPLAVTFRFCTGAGDFPFPTWFAYQSGGDEWKQVPKGPDESYAFTIAGRGGVAFVLPRSSGPVIRVIYGTAEELAFAGGGLDYNCRFFGGAGANQISGQVAGVSAANAAAIYLGPIGQFVSGRTVFTLQRIPTGPVDLVALRTNVNFPRVTDRLIIRRGLDLPDGAGMPLLDFDAAEAVAPVSHTIVVANAPAESERSGWVAYQTARGTPALLTDVPTAGAPIPYQGVPVSAQVPGDLHHFSVFFDESSENGPSGRFLTTAFHAAGNRTVSLGRPLPAPSIRVVATTPYFRHRARFDAPSEYAGSATVWFFIGGNGLFSVQMTAGYVGETPSTWELTVPDLSGVPGFRTEWVPSQSGIGLQIEASSAGIISLPSDGETMLFAYRNHDFQPAAGLQITRARIVPARDARSSLPVR